MSGGVHFSDSSSRFFEEINRARTQPRLLLDELAQLKKLYSGNHFLSSETGSAIYTSEGISAVDSAIEFVAKVEPVRPLARSPELDHSAQLLVTSLGLFGAKETPEGDLVAEKRIQAALGEDGVHGESVLFGWSQPKLAVLQLIICDGEPERENRLSLFSPNFSKVGVALGPHQTHHFCYVVDFFGESQSISNLDKYQLTTDEFPENAVSFQRKVSTKRKSNRAIVTMEYDFFLPDGEVVNRVKTFEEQLEKKS